MCDVRVIRDFRITNDFHVTKANGQFSASILLGISEVGTIVITPSCLTLFLHVASMSPPFPGLPPSSISFTGFPLPTL